MDSKSKLIEELLQRNIIVEEYYFDFPYLRFKDDYKKYKRGTVVLEGNIIIPSYPKIARIFVLEEGIKRHFRESFFIEEKADGYNVRVVKNKGETYGITRGGFICPFTTDRLRDLADFNSFFEQYPYYVICGEVVGPNNPYMELYPPYVKEDIAFLAFDIFDLQEERFLLPEDKYQIFKETGIPSVNVYGSFGPDMIEAVKDLILGLNQKEIEGVVFKSSTKPRKAYKYSTPLINIKDIEADAELLLDLPGQFFTQRILRFILSVTELNIPVGEEIKLRIGRAFIDEFKKCVKKFYVKGKVTREYTLYFNSLDNIYEFLKLEKKASTHVKIELKSIERSGNKYKVKLEKVFWDSTSKLKRITRGNVLYD